MTLIEMMREFHEEHLPYPFCPETAEETCRAFMEVGQIFQADKGFLMAVAQTAPTNADWLIAAEVFWWSRDGSGGALWRQFRKWAGEIGANEVRASCPVSAARVGKFWENTGMTNCEAVYSEVVKCA